MTKKWILTFLIASILIFSMSVQVIAEEEEDEQEEGAFEVIDAIVITIMSIAIIITFIAMIKRKDLFKYILGFLTFWFAYLFQSLEELTANDFFCVLISISVLIAALIFFVAVYVEYYTQVLNKRKMNIKNPIKSE